ncbi:MAG: acyl-ACP--UDP-N-acetylglucosamine O-acyltransferase [Deltaproteobacteria bacterium]|nr:acyl-ACP--UDP-N-acetylglucosamine O-acyltransferase [Deltaproteobacteria bacterium]
MNNPQSAIRNPQCRIHATAVIQSGAEIDEGVEIGPYSVIGKDVTIGKGTIVSSHAVIEGWTTIGPACKIHQFVSIGAPPQHLKYKGEKTEVIIGKNNEIREYVTIHRAIAGSGNKTIIGDNNFFMAYVHIAHDCRIENNVIMANVATLAGHVEIGDHAFVGGLVAVHQFARIGAYAMIGGASAITHDVPPYVIAVGNRAKLYGLNKVGLKRQGFSREEIDGLKKAYTILFKSGLTLKDAVGKLEEEMKHSTHVAKLLEFIKSSKRGITRETGRRAEEDETD